jgi:hypothetical protein
VKLDHKPIDSMQDYWPRIEIGFIVVPKTRSHVAGSIMSLLVQEVCDLQNIKRASMRGVKTSVKL